MNRTTQCSGIAELGQYYRQIMAQVLAESAALKYTVVTPLLKQNMGFQRDCRG